MSDRDHSRGVSGRRRIAATAALVLALASIWLPAARASAEQFGANTGVLFNSGAYDQAQVDAQLGALAQTGATVARSDAFWEYAEPNPPIGVLHRYNWSYDDGVAGALAAHGLQWLPIIDYSTAWAQSVSGKDHSPPAWAPAYAAYAAALAARYGPGGLFWLEHPQLTPQPVGTYEIWNEPDNPVFWYLSPNPAAYAGLYAAARNAIIGKQPGAQVIVGGLTHPAPFLGAMLASDPQLRGQIDGVAIHPYAATPSSVLGQVRDARLAMRSDGIGGVPLYVTEFGWTTVRHRGVPDWAPESARPAYISQTLAALGHSDCNIAAAVLYAWATPQRDPANPQDWFGVSPPGAGPGPDSAAFASGIQAAATPGATSSLCTAPVVQAVNAKRVQRPRARRARTRRARTHRRNRAHR